MSALNSIARGLLILNDLTYLFTGCFYLNGLSTNQWTILNDLFIPSLSSSCSGSHHCWQVLIPFYATLFLALGSVSVAAGASFGIFEAGMVLLGCAAANAGQGWVRLAVVPQHLYQDGAAWAATRGQYLVAGISAATALAVLLQETTRRKAKLQ